MVSWLGQLQGSDEPHTHASQELANHFHLIGSGPSVRASRWLNTVA